MSGEEVVEALMAIRRDPKAALQFDELQLEDMMHTCSRLHGSGTLEDDEYYNEEGFTPNLREYRLRCSTINLAKMELLQRKNPTIFSAFGQTLEGRWARIGVSKMLGLDLQELLAKADTHFIRQEEMDRIERRHNDRMGCMHARPCSYFMKDEQCSRPYDCTHFHLTREK